MTLLSDISILVSPCMIYKESHTSEQLKGCYKRTLKQNFTLFSGHWMPIK